MNTDKKPWKFVVAGGVLLLALTLCGIVGGGMAMMAGMGGRFGGAPAYGVPYYDDQLGPAQPSAPGADQPAPRYAPPMRRAYAYPQYGYRGFSPFGVIGGIFRLFITLALIGLFFMFVRGMLRGGRRWGGSGGHWMGGPGRQWGDTVPPWVEAWHRKMHESDAAPASKDAPVTDAPASPAADAPANTDAI